MQGGKAHTRAKTPIAVAGRLGAHKTEEEMGKERKKEGGQERMASASSSGSELIWADLGRAELS